MVCQPQYVLFCDSSLSLPVASDGNCEPLVGLGSWHFILDRLDGAERLEAVDSEPQIHRDRIALLAVIRGLEALEHPSHVRLVTTSRYVDRGMRFGLPNWRDANYLWESFGTLKPIRNADLWQRVSSALQYHQISCRILKSNNELVESLIGSRRKLPAFTEASPRPARGSKLQHIPGELAISQCSAVPSTNPMPSTIAPQQDSAGFPKRNGVPSRPQWWEMAATWVESINRSPALAH